MLSEHALSLQSDVAGERWLRWLMVVLGWANVGLGVMGIIVPGMPTTVFLIVAAWAFSRGSARFHRWLWFHPRLGPSVRAWYRHRAIPYPAKVAAVASMSASFAFVCAVVARDWTIPTVMAATMLPAAAYILSRPTLVESNP